MTKLTLKDKKHYAPWLWLLNMLFAFRVVAQLLQARFAIPFLPAFEQWQGSSLPYSILLLSQILILLVFAIIAWRYPIGRMAPCALVGVTMLSLGGVYFAVMLVRLVLGLTVLSHSHWFASYPPALFRLVLAGFLLLAGDFHWRKRGRACESARQAQ